MYMNERLGKYSNLPDSLPEKYRGNRGSGTGVFDTGGIYEANIIPLLDSLNITLKKKMVANDSIVFTDGKKMYRVNLEEYKEDDGVLMFTPGKRPVFWNAARKYYCDEKQLIRSYYMR